MPDPDILTIAKGTVVAPAGCGKTHLIIDAIQRHEFDKPILVLTHTNAGVAALRHRLQELSVPKHKYRLTTIDGWAIRLASTFPMRSGYSAGAKPKSPNYLKIRQATWKLLKESHVAELIVASYSMILVDEYQDCSYNQHAIVYFAAKCLPTCLLGDPLQSIFGFGDDRLAHWDDEVCKHFPLSGELTTPWRWRNADNEELGNWLLSARQTLIDRRPIDISNSPESVRWTKLEGDKEDHKRLVTAARCKHKSKGETTLVIGDSRSAPSRYRIAKSVPGIVTVEPVELKDLTKFASTLELGDGHSLEETLEFAKSVLTNVDVKGTIQRVKSLTSGRATKPATEMELAAIDLHDTPTLPNVANLLSACSKQTECRNYRPAVSRSCLQAISMCTPSNDVGFEEAAILVREQNRAVGRQLPRNAIGSTLLLKGLEADHVVVLNADQLDAKNLYVAMTRGSKTVTLCSKTRALNPK